ncbi:MAG: hypothetical protein ONB43_15415 [candidate division KSB1 bacterium]|nr:hypothetical protein [candidate division KSB1 bacterium]
MHDSLQGLGLKFLSQTPSLSGISSPVSGEKDKTITAIYILKMTEHSISNNILQVTIQCIDQSKSDLVAKPFKIKFNSYGKYDEIHIRTDKVFLNYQSSIAEVCQSVLESGYRWLVERVKRMLNSIQSSAAENLYSHLRKLLPEQIVNQIWLYAITENKGIYIPDTIARKVALDKMSRRKLNVGESPIKLIADFSTTLIDFERTFSKIAIADDTNLIKDFVNVPYTESGLQIAEAAIYQVSGYVIQPLVREGKTLLTTGYSIDLKTEVEPILKKESEEFRKIVEREKSKLSNIVRQLKEQTLPPALKAELAEYAGRFAKGLFGL